MSCHIDCEYQHIPEEIVSKMLSYSEIPLENWTVGKSSSVVYSSAFPQCDLRQVKFNFINLRCGSLFLKLQIRCPWQLSCKLSPQSTFLQIVVLNNFLQIVLLDTFVLKFCKSPFWIFFAIWHGGSFFKFLKIGILNNFFANCCSGQLFCKFSFWTIFQMLHIVAMSNLVLQIVTSENFCSASILLNFGKNHLC